MQIPRRIIASLNSKFSHPRHCPPTLGSCSRILFEYHGQTFQLTRRNPECRRNNTHCFDPWSCVFRSISRFSVQLRICGVALLSFICEFCASELGCHLHPSLQRALVKIGPSFSNLSEMALAAFVRTYNMYVCMCICILCVHMYVCVYVLRFRFKSDCALNFAKL